jgi:hypothetical protein
MNLDDPMMIEDKNIFKHEKLKATVSDIIQLSPDLE